MGSARRLRPRGGGRALGAAALTQSPRLNVTNLYELIHSWDLATAHLVFWRLSWSWWDRGTRSYFSACKQSLVPAEPAIACQAGSGKQCLTSGPSSTLSIAVQCSSDVDGHVIGVARDAFRIAVHHPPQLTLQVEGHPRAGRGAGEVVVPDPSVE